MKKSHQYILTGAAALIVALFLVTTVAPKPGSQLIAFDNQPVPSDVLSLLNVSQSVSSNIGIGLATNFPRNITGPPLQENGKPEILYIGAEFCPFCAIERWGMVVALMRFGSFTGLKYTTSSATDTGPNTPTFTFANSIYTSSYIAFVPVETVGNAPNSSGQYPVIQELTASQLAIQNKYDSNSNIPFMDFANKTVQIGASYQYPDVLANENWSTIANKLRNTSSAESEAILGSANVFTAEICLINGGVPKSVCGQQYILSTEKLIG